MFRHLNSFLTHPCVRGKKEKKSFVHLFSGAGLKEKVRGGMFKGVFVKLPAYLPLCFCYYHTRSSERISFCVTGVDSKLSKSAFSLNAPLGLETCFEMNFVWKHFLRNAIVSHVSQVLFCYYMELLEISDVCFYSVSM